MNERGVGFVSSNLIQSIYTIMSLVVVLLYWLMFGIRKYKKSIPNPEKIQGRYLHKYVFIPVQDKF